MVCRSFSPIHLGAAFSTAMEPNWPPAAIDRKLCALASVPQCTQATINFDAVTLFADHNQEKMRDVQRHYGSQVRIRFNQPNCIFTLESRSPDLSVQEVMKQVWTGVASGVLRAACAIRSKRARPVSIICRAPRKARMNSPTPVLPLRFAVIGCGSVARAQHIPNIVKSSANDASHLCRPR